MISFPYRIPLPHRATLFPYTTLFRSDAGTDVRATDIDRKHRVVSFQYPRWKKVSCSNQSCLVWMIVKKLDGEICLVFLEQDAGTGDGELADAPGAETAAEHDTLCVTPRLLAHKALDDIAQLPSKVLNGALDDRSSFRVAFAQQRFQLLFADAIAVLLAKGIFPILPQ